MNKKKPYLQASDYNREMFHTLRNVRFEWNIIYACNYRCPYCFFEGKWEEYGKRNVILSPDEWGVLWKRVYGIYGPVSIILTGGEPFIYPEFIKIIKIISLYHSPINVSTNGMGDIKKAVLAWDSKMVSVTLSFHPGFNKLEDTIRKQKFLRQGGFAAEYINLCVYPTFIEILNEYADIVEKEGEELKIIPFIGEYKGRKYPDAYTAAEKEILGMNETWEKNVKRKGTLCAAGMKSALIFPDGKVARCGQIGERFLIGNFFSEDFRLLDRPLVCDAEMCPCLEVVEI